MKKLIDYLYQFDRRLNYAIYDVQNDFGFGCMDKVSIAADLGFPFEQSGIVQKVVPHPFQTVEEVEQFPWNISLNGIYTQAELNMVREWFAHSAIHQGGGSFGPLTITACILGIEECIRMTLKRPEVLHAVIKRVTDFLILLSKEEERSGADSYWIAEPVASLLSPKACRTFCIPYIRKIFDTIDIPGVLHVCGNTNHHTLALLETGAQALSIDYCTNLPDCLALVPDDVVIMGNINPILLWEGSLDEVREQTLLLLEQTRNYKNFVMATGCQVPFDAPRENVQLFVDLTRSASVWTNEEYRTITHLASLYSKNDKDLLEKQETNDAIPSRLADAALDIVRKKFAAYQKYAE